MRLKRSTGVWSGIQSIAVKIGSDIIELKTNMAWNPVEWRYYINDPELSNPYYPNSALPQSTLGGWAMDLFNPSLKITHPSGCGSIEIKRFHSIYGFAVYIEGRDEEFDTCFADSVGMCSAYDLNDQGLYDRSGEALVEAGRFKNSFGTM